MAIRKIREIGDEVLKEKKVDLLAASDLYKL